MSQEINHKYTDNAVCPYCGREDYDSWELGCDNDECGESECGSCGKAYIWIRHVFVEYSTKRKEVQND